MSELTNQNRRQNTRCIRLRHFISRNVLDVFDDGCDERGAPNQQRQHLERILGHVVRVGDAEFPLFVLEEAPGAWPSARNDREAAIRQMDAFDQRVLKWMTPKGMGWKMASPEWTAASEKANAADTAKTDELRARSAAERAAKGLDAIAMMRDLAASTKAATARKASPA